MNRRMWDDRYSTAAASDSTVWSRTPNAFVEQTVASLDPGAAIDLGAGEGRNAIWLAERGWEVTAVDFSAVGLETGRRRAEQLGLEVSWVEADVTTWVSPSLVDLVVIAYLQLPGAELRAAISSAAGALAPGGTLVVVGHAVENLDQGTGGPQDRALLHRLADLRQAASGLEIDRCTRVRRAVGDDVAIDAVLVARRG